MRLGQLARKLALQPSDITEFLNSQRINIADGVNTRLDDQQVAVVLQRFAPELLVAQVVKEEEIISEDLTNTEVVQNAVEPVLERQPEAVEIVQEEPSAESEAGSDQPEIVETIKAQKVALSGLKVLGKIELPEKKKKPEAPLVTDETPAQENPTTTEQPQRPDRRRSEYNRRDQRDQRPRKNPVAAAREREQREAEEKKIEDQRKKKEQRTKNYHTRVQAKAPTKAARLVDEDTVDISNEDLRPAPKTLLGKFWRWFRS